LSSSYTSSSENKTEVLYGTESILKSTLEITSKVEHSIDNCIDSSAPLSFVSKDLPMFKALSEAKKKASNQDSSLKLQKITLYIVKN